MITLLDPVRTGPHTVVGVTGELDVATSPMLRDSLLALVNRGGACTADLVRVARAIRDGVRDRFGVELVPEPVLVGVAL